MKYGKQGKMSLRVVLTTNFPPAGRDTCSIELYFDGVARNATAFLKVNVAASVLYAGVNDRTNASCPRNEKYFREPVPSLQ